MSEKPKEPEITKRELLSFCQLANLDWQFVNMKMLEKKESTILSKALNPNYFLRTKKDLSGKITEENIAIYGKDEKGRIALRKKMGMTMELLEKKESGSKEGSYLDEWEVLEGYDNYALEREIMEKNWVENEKEIDKEKKKLESEIKEILKLQTMVSYSQGITAPLCTDEEKEMIISGQCTLKILEEKKSSLKKKVDTRNLKERLSIPLTEAKECIKKLEEWLSLHLPEREIIEAEMKDEKIRIRNKMIVKEIINIGVIVVCEASNIYITKKKMSSKSPESKKITEQFPITDRSIITAQPTIVNSLIEKIKDEKMRRIVTNCYDVLTKSPEFLKVTVREFSEILKKNASGLKEKILQELIDEVRLKSELVTIDKIADFTLDRIYAAYLGSATGKKLNTKLEITIVEKSNYEDTGLRILVLKKTNKIVIALGIGENEDKKSNNLKGYIKKGKLTKEGELLYCNKIKYIYDKYNIGKNEITMVGLGENGALCHLFKLLIDDKKLKVVTFNPLPLHELVDITAKDLGKNVISNTDQEFCNELEEMISDELKVIAVYSIKLTVVVAILAVISMFAFSKMYIAISMAKVFMWSSLSLGISYLNNKINFDRAKNRIEGLKLNGFLESKEIKGKASIMGYVSDTISEKTFNKKSLKVKIGEEKEIEIIVEPNTGMEDILYLLGEVESRGQVGNHIVTKEGYNIVFENQLCEPNTENTSFFTDTVVLKNNNGIYNIEKIISEVEIKSKSGEKIIEYSTSDVTPYKNELLEMLKILKRIQDIYIKLQNGTEIENYYLGNYVKEEKDKQGKNPPEWIGEGLGGNIMLGVREKRNVVNENLFFPFVGKNGEWNEMSSGGRVRIEYVVSALRSYLEISLSTREQQNKVMRAYLEREYIDLNFNLLEKNRQIIKANYDRGLITKNNTVEEIIKTLEQHWERLAESDGNLFFESEKKKGRGQYFLSKNILIAINKTYKGKLENYIEKIVEDEDSTTMGIGVNGNKYIAKELNYGYLTDGLGEEDLIRRGVYQFTQKSTRHEENNKGEIKGVKIVVSDTILSCTYGVGTVHFIATYVENRLLEGEKGVGTIADGKGGINIPRFQKCMANGKSSECNIVTGGKWEKGAGSVNINESKILCSHGEITCKAKGGIIKVEKVTGEGVVSRE